MENINVWLWFGSQLVAGAAIWGAIRADIKHMHNRIDIQREDIKESRQQINKLFEMHYTSQRNNG